MQSITIEIGPGELFDRLSILRIKNRRASADKVRAATGSQVEQLLALRRSIPDHDDVRKVEMQLADVNGKLWDVEDQLRLLERAARFDSEFIELARSVYRLNDERCALKQQIDIALGWTPTEFKVYSEAPVSDGTNDNAAVSRP
ncbi:MAG: DUF6165 family protein [Planctomycetaceae bacterium]